MIICPECKSAHLVGTLFCSECGSKISDTDIRSTQSLRKASTNSFRSSTPVTPSASAVSEAPPEVSLHIVESGKVIQLAGKQLYVLGRSSDGQDKQPDIDLGPYEAYIHGVSRLHASIKVSHQRVSITDLGSSNGTRVNGQKISPQIEYPLNHGDVIALGKLKLQFLLRE